MDDLKALRERVDNCTGPDREIDRDVHMMLKLYPEGIEDIGCYYDDAAMGCTGGEIYTAEPYSASIDACVSLIEMKFPGAYINSAGPGFRLEDGFDGFGAQICPNNESIGGGYTGRAYTRCTALLSALLAALSQPR